MPALQFQRRIGNPKHLRKEGVWADCVFFGMPDFGEISHGFTRARLNSNAYIRQSPLDRGAYSATTSGSDLAYWALPTAHPLYTITSNFTILCLLNVATLAAYSQVWSAPYRSSGWTAPYQSLGLARSASTSSLVLSYADSTTQRKATSSTGLIQTTDGDTWYGVRRVGADVRFYRDGFPYGSDATITNAVVDWNEKRPPCVLAHSSTHAGEGVVGTAMLALVFRRGLTDQEVLDVVNDPYWATRDDDFRIISAGGVVTSSFSARFGAIGSSGAAKSVSLGLSAIAGSTGSAAGTKSASAGISAIAGLLGALETAGVGTTDFNAIAGALVSVTHSTARLSTIEGKVGSIGSVTGLRGAISSLQAIAGSVAAIAGTTSLDRTSSFAAIAGAAAALSKTTARIAELAARAGVLGTNTAATIRAAQIAAVAGLRAAIAGINVEAAGALLTVSVSAQAAYECAVSARAAYHCTATARAAYNCTVSEAIVQ